MMTKYVRRMREIFIMIGAVLPGLVKNLDQLECPVTLLF